MQVDLLGTRGSRACEARRGCDQCWSNQSVCLCSPLETDLAMDQSHVCVSVLSVPMTRDDRIDCISDTNCTVRGVQCMGVSKIQVR